MKDQKYVVHEIFNKVEISPESAVTLSIGHFLGPTVK